MIFGRQVPLTAFWRGEVCFAKISVRLNGQVDPESGFSASLVEVDRELDEFKSKNFKSRPQSPLEILKSFHARWFASQRKNSIRSLSLRLPAQKIIYGLSSKSEWFCADLAVSYLLGTEDFRPFSARLLFAKEPKSQFPLPSFKFQNSKSISQAVRELQHAYPEVSKVKFLDQLEKNQFIIDVMKF